MEDRPELRLPPSGTRGVEMPGLIRLLFKATSFVEDLMFRRGGKVQGRRLLRLSTVAARTGKRRETDRAAYVQTDSSALIIG